jgi:hypothetical protein
MFDAGPLATLTIKQIAVIASVLAITTEELLEALLRSRVERTEVFQADSARELLHRS